MARIVVCGYMIRHPVAGNVLAYLHYVLGLTRLGHDVLYLEESGWNRSCYNPATDTCSDDPGHGLKNLHALLSAFGASARIAYFRREPEQLYGMSKPDLECFLREADLLLNIGGVCWMPDFLLCRRRALIDMDPFFTQVGKMGVEGFDTYHTYFTYGGNIGQPNCPIPTRNVRWHATVPPVVGELWQHDDPMDDPGNETAPFTTIASWSAYGTATYNGEVYGQKDVEFCRMADLPNHVNHKLELAVSGASADIIDRFRGAGWSMRKSSEVSLDIATYRSYITSSRGEFSVAKHAYVATRSGWFSDRSVCYLAAGRPVILQDTGFSDWLPSGRGVLAFSTQEEAAACIGEVNTDYSAHAEAARQIAAERFGHEHVLPAVLDVAMSNNR